MAKVYKPKFQTRGSKASDERRDIHAEITTKIVDQLKAGTLPWLRPWAPVKGAAGDTLSPFGGMPRNAVTRRRYSGINVVLLWCAAQEKGYAAAQWLTFKQAKERGGSVRKGEHGTQIIFYKPLTIKDKASQEDKDILMARVYTVFNVEQCDDLRLPASKKAPPAAPVVPAGEGIEAELCPAYMAAVKKTDADISHGGNAAYYMPAIDAIRLPPMSQFVSAANYQATLAHELIHWTGHKDRLDRLTTNDPKAYAFEELIAELGAAFTCAEFGLTGELRHASYIESWIKLLEDDKRAVFRAASRASKAVAFLYPETTAEEADNENPVAAMYPYYLNLRKRNGMTAKEAWEKLKADGQPTKAAA